MGFFSQFKPVSIKIFDDGNEQKIEVVNNPNNKWAPAEVVRWYENKEKGISAVEMGSFEDFIENKQKRIK